MKTRYSKYIRPILLIIDLIIINSIPFFILVPKQNYYLYIYLSFFWFVSTLVLGYYKIYRYTNPFKVVNLVFKQGILFSFGFFSYFGIFNEGTFVNGQFNTLLILFCLTAVIKAVFFILIKNYRRLGKNYRKVIFLEKDSTTDKIITLFQKKKYLGYSVEGFFSNTHSKTPLYLGTSNEIYQYTLDNIVDEIYVSLSKIKKEEVKRLTKFSSENNIHLKLIPDSNELYSKSQEVEVYEGAFKVLSVKKLPFDFIENHILKRVFDAFFSFFVILFLMSWLTPILWILIKLESKGPLFFKQEREGLNGNRFSCYKFRSMKINKEANKLQATKNDFRITKIGAFIRKTSIDELPQFFNVLLGDMSVVGPRPHMDLHSIKFEHEVNNYIKRHAVKPGITGLAQTRGYRGEIKKKSDIENRVRLDIFYIENWSFLFDVKIILNTIFNVFKGEEKAY